MHLLDNLLDTSCQPDVGNMDNFEHWCMTILRNGGPGYLQGAVQYGKTQKMLIIADHARKMGLIPLIVTQPDLALRSQGHDAVDDSEFELGGHLKFEDVSKSALRSRILIFDIMQVQRAEALAQELDRLRETEPYFYRDFVAQRLVLIKDEGDLFIENLDEFVEAERDPKRREILEKRIARIETVLHRFVEHSHAVFNVSATISTNLLSEIRRDKPLLPGHIFVLEPTDADYQGLADFERHDITNLSGSYDAQSDGELLNFVDAVMARDDEPVALVNVHKHTKHHRSISEVINEHLIAKHSNKSSRCGIIEVNKNEPNPIAQLIGDAHIRGQSYIFVVGGKKLDRGIRCASANVFGKGGQPGDNRYATDHFLRPPRLIVLPALLQQMRLSGRYSGRKPRRLWMPSDARNSLEGFYNLQKDLLNELRKPEPTRSRAIKLADGLDKKLGPMMVLMSVRHHQFVGAVDELAPKTMDFSDIEAARSFCEREDYEIRVQSEVIRLDDLDGTIDPMHRRNVIQDFLRQEFGREFEVRAYSPNEPAESFMRLWRSAGESIDLGPTESAGETHNLVLVTHYPAAEGNLLNGVQTRCNIGEVRVQLSGMRVTGIRLLLLNRVLELSP
jgi:hypothetical protein